MGLSVLPYMANILQERKVISDLYDQMFEQSDVKRLQIRRGTEWNYSYYPVVFNSEPVLLTVLSALEAEQIFPRRYFYPSLNRLPYLKEVSMPTSESLASRIVCLPIFPTLQLEDVERISKIIIQHI